MLSLLAVIDPMIWDAIKGVCGFIGAIFFAIGGYWCKTMAEDIKKLQANENESKVFIAEIRAKTSEREKLQDERWEGLKKDIAGLHRDINILIQSQLTNKKQE